LGSTTAHSGLPHPGTSAFIRQMVVREMRNTQASAASPRPIRDKRWNTTAHTTTNRATFHAMNQTGVWGVRAPMQRATQNAARQVHVVRTAMTASLID